MEQCVAVVSVEWKESYRSWLMTSGKHGRGEKTICAYLSDAGLFARWFEQINSQAFEPGLISSIDLRAYREHSIGADGVKPTTWNRRRVSLAMMCEWARSAGFLTYDPFQGVDVYEEEELPPRWLTKSERARVLRQIERDANAAKTNFGRMQALRNQAMVALMIYAGLREGEVASLEMRDLELSQRTGKVIVRLGKGQKRREVPLGSEVRRAISAWLLVRSEAGEGEPVFIGKGGGRLTTRQMQREVAGIGRMCDVALTPHMLRHTFAKRLVDSGVALTVIQKLMGHARLETTARYTKPGWDDLADAVEKI